MGFERKWSWPAILLFVVGAAFLFGGCGGGGESENLCGEVECGENQICVDGYCVGDEGDCDPACPSGEYCSSGRCVSSSGSCEYHGQACPVSRYGFYTDDHLCMDWTTNTGQEAVCSADCRSMPCPAQSACYRVTVDGVGACTSDESCLSGQFCFQGSCAFAVCRPSDCSLPGGQDDECGMGQRCERISAGINLCVPSGQREIGESCIDGGRAYEEARLAESCQADGICVGGTCLQYCDEGSCSDANESCIPVRDVGGPFEVRACVHSCEPFEEETGCSSTETCIPTSGGAGVCQAAGSTAAFEACVPGGDGCEVGTVCAMDESDRELGRCLPVCDLSAGAVGEDGRLGSQAQRDRDLTCPQAEQVQGAWTLWHLAEALGPLEIYLGDDTSAVAEVQGGQMAELGADSVFAERDQGLVSWALRPSGATATDVPLAEGQFELGPGQVRLVVAMPEPGRDNSLEADVVELDEGVEVYWLQAIPDLEPVDVWITDVQGTSTLELEGFAAGQVRGLPARDGVFDVRLLPEGADEEDPALLEFSGLNFGEGQGFVAFRGTMDNSDVHAVDPPVIRTDAVPDLAIGAPLALTCRAVNEGSVGGCMELCDGGAGLDMGRCAGEGMGCGPRWHRDRSQWSTICQPHGDLDEGQPCDPRADLACGEGLYCQEYGEAAPHVTGPANRGLCTPLCTQNDDSSCPEGSGCRLIAAGSDYVVGECRNECEPDGSYFDAACPDGLQWCKPESTLVPEGDGVSGGYDIQHEQPFCWASGTTQAGATCAPGNCVPGTECLFGRSEQTDLVSTLLSPYFATAGQAPRCRLNCDPFTNSRADHQCGPEETCLFNYPWSADVGHCAEIVETRDIDEACDSPGLACGEDSICVLNGMQQQCIRFCQFIGQGSGGYERSTCPVSFECQPYISDIGICRASN